MASAPLQAVASLLHESAPQEVPATPRHLAVAPPLPGGAAAPPLLHQVLPGQQAVEPTQLLSNGRYHVALRANGAGSSRLLDQALTRVRDDALQDACGSFFYLRGDIGAAPVSITQHPAPDPRARYSSVFHADRQVLEAHWPGLSCRLTVWVSPEDDVEFRQVELNNHGTEPLTLELLSAFELALSSQAADESHPAFNNLFVGARWLPPQQALWFERQPRLATETPLHLAHFLAERGEAPPLALQGQTARMAWCGRGRPASAPLAQLQALPAQGPALMLDTQLDPVCALGVPVQLPALGQARLVFATAASRDALTLHALVDKYRQPSHTQRASLMSATLAVMQMRNLGLDAGTWAAVQTLTTALALGLSRGATVPPGPPAPGGPGTPAGHPGAHPAAQPCDRRLLWRLGLSGERPLLVVHADRPASLGLLRHLAQALRWWNWGGQACDLVVVNTEPVAYLMPLHGGLGALRDRYHAEAGGAGGAWVLLQAGELSAAELGSLQALARVQLQADGSSLAQAVAAWARPHETALLRRQLAPPQALPVAARAAAVPADPDGAGGGPHPRGHFSPGGETFSFTVGPAWRPPRPWLNVLANPDFGCMVSDSGPGFTWAGNSRLHQLTPWSNDPVADPPPAWLLLQDLADQQVWSATANAWGQPGVVYTVVHGAGHTRISHQRGTLDVVLECCVDAAQPLQQWRLHLHNRGQATRRLRVVAGAEWQLGERRSDRFTVHTRAHRQRVGQGQLTALLATQTHATAGLPGAAHAGAGPTAWLAAVDPAESEDWTCDRREFFNTEGDRVLPATLGRGQGAGLDPCAALGQRWVLAPGAQVECLFLLGHAPSPEAAMAQAARASAVPAAQRLQALADFWDPLLAATTVNTPDALFDALVNRWLLYQAISSRLWAKAGLYQAGGATGFRDQLQDCLALAWAAPALLRQQVLRCAGRQFAEGDVQHWWHAPSGAGVRTRSSDDLLWLPHALLHYLAATGDHGLLDEHCAFLTGPTVPNDAEDLYFTPGCSDEQASVYEHAARALDRSLRHGEHGLPLMGGGDWNDGMNTVGAAGRGESVWLAWLLFPLVAGMAPLARQRREPARAERWEAAARGWQAALESAAWDGRWYRRAFFDDGSVLGGQANPEARIDLIAQAWAVLSTAAPVPRQQQAMQALRSHLVDGPAQLLRLLHPPLAHARPVAGYIQAYPPGVRENGGQYTHAGVWALMAQAQLEREGLAEASDLPYAWFTWLSPAHRSADPTVGPLYGLEPYAVAGDVCSAEPHTGRGGWSWTTGAAAWLHPAAVGSLFGLHQDAEHLWLCPALPAHWPSAEVSLRRGTRVMHFLVLQGDSEDQVQGDSQRLQPGERVRWTALPACSRFVLRLPARSDHTAAV
jgi:cyclic beta-1,2-glucan synthetase